MLRFDLVGARQISFRANLFEQIYLRANLSLPTRSVPTEYQVTLTHLQPATNIQLRDATVV